MGKIMIYHGSQQIVCDPIIKDGQIHKDFGAGFYCTRKQEEAKAWACKNGNDGFVNAYELNLSGLRVLKLNDKHHHPLNWLAVLLQNRVFHTNSALSKRAAAYVAEEFSVDTEGYDVIIGCRADSSVFAIAQDFVKNALPLAALKNALRLAKKQEQIVLCSEKAIGKLTFVAAEPVDAAHYYPAYAAADLNFRKKCKAQAATTEGDIYVLDMLRQEMKNDDPRI